jgi:uncharacterized protein (DUF4213/DUF364 family)
VAVGRVGKEGPQPDLAGTVSAPDAGRRCPTSEAFRVSRLCVPIAGRTWPDNSDRGWDGRLGETAPVRRRARCGGSREAERRGRRPSCPLPVATDGDGPGGFAVIVERIEHILEAEAKSTRIADVRMGLGYTAVLTESGSAGVAYTPREELGRGCSVFPGRQPLAGRMSVELLTYLRSSSALERAVGLATANALIRMREVESTCEGDVLDVLALKPGDRVGMVGYFEPLVPRVESEVASLTIFERSRGWAAGVQPAERAVDLLPSCTVALITSSTLITESLDALLEAATGCRVVALLGPSTPLLSKAFAGTPVTWLSGTMVTHPMDILRVVSEGGGARAFSPFVRKVNVRIVPGR